MNVAKRAAPRRCPARDHDHVRPIGRFTKRTQRQDNWVRSPPRTTPLTAPTDPERRPEPNGAGPLGTLRESADEDAHGPRRQQRRARPLQESRAHQLTRRLGQPSEQTHGTKHREPDQEHAPTAEEAGRPAPDEQGTRERDGAPRDDSRQPPFVEIQDGTDGGTRHGDDGRVEEDHVLRRAGHQDRDALARSEDGGSRGSRPSG